MIFIKYSRHYSKFAAVLDYEAFFFLYYVKQANIITLEFSFFPPKKTYTRHINAATICQININFNIFNLNIKLHFLGVREKNRFQIWWTSKKSLLYE